MWGTQINASLYYCGKHLRSIENVLKKLNREEAAVIPKFKEFIDNQTLKLNLISTKTILSSLPEYITRLETPGLPLCLYTNSGKFTTDNSIIKK